MSYYRYTDLDGGSVAIRPYGDSARLSALIADGDIDIAVMVDITASEAPKLCRAIYEACGREWVEAPKELPTVPGSVIRAKTVRGIEHDGDGWVLRFKSKSWFRIDGGLIDDFYSHHSECIGDWVLMQITEAES